MTSFIDRLRERMAGSLSKPAPLPQVEKSRQTISTNRWDERTWKEVRKQRKIDDLINDLDLGDEHRGGTRPGFSAAPELIHDLFMAFYKANPTLLDKRQIHSDALPARKLMQELLDDPQLKELQDLTVGQTTESTIALVAMEDVVTQYIARIPPPPPPPAPPQPKSQQSSGDKSEPNEAQVSAGGGGNPDEQDGDGNPQDGANGDASEQGGASGQSDDSGDDRSEDQSDGSDGSGSDGSGEDQGAGDQEWEDYVDDYESQIDKELDTQHVAYKALEAARGEIGDLDNIRKGIGLQDGEWAAMSPEERLEMAARLRTPEMKALAEIVGRMKRFAMGIKANRINDVPEEIYEVENGNDIRRIVPSEFALLATPESTHEFYRRYVDQELLQYKLRGTEEVGKGPIIIAIDKSGSMNGDPFHWAMGVAESLRRFAAEQDRDYYAMFFGTNDDRNRFEFPKGKGAFDKVLSFLSVEANGGTEFTGVLEEALNRATNSFDGDARGKGDIVFVTDGMANLSDSWIERFNQERGRIGCRMYSVYIGGAYDMSYLNAPTKLLERISDAVIPVKDLKPESASLIFQKV